MNKNKVLKLVLFPVILMSLLLSAGCSFPVCCAPQADTQATEKFKLNS